MATTKTLQKLKPVAEFIWAPPFEECDDEAVALDEPELATVETGATLEDAVIPD